MVVWACAPFLACFATCFHRLVSTHLSRPWCVHHSMAVQTTAAWSLAHSDQLSSHGRLAAWSFADSIVKPPSVADGIFNLLHFAQNLEFIDLQPFFMKHISFTWQPQKSL
jgi:hypothetical protein